MSRVREREVSTRLIRPTLHEIDLNRVIQMVYNFDPNWETNGEITVFDEGIAQYSLVDPISHLKFYAALILNKPSLRCTVINDEPNDILESKDNIFTIIDTHHQVPKTSEVTEIVDQLKNVLSKRGYRFSN